MNQTWGIKGPKGNWKVSVAVKNARRLGGKELQCVLATSEWIRASLLTF